MALEIWPSLVLPVLFVVNSLICRGCSTRGCHWRWWWGWWSSRALSARRSQSPPGCPTWRWVVKCICTFIDRTYFTMAGTSSLHQCGPWGSPRGRCQGLPLPPDLLSTQSDVVRSGGQAFGWTYFGLEPVQLVWRGGGGSLRKAWTHLVEWRPHGGRPDTRSNMPSTGDINP